MCRHFSLIHIYKIIVKDKKMITKFEYMICEYEEQADGKRYLQLDKNVESNINN